MLLPSFYITGLKCVSFNNWHYKLTCLLIIGACKLLPLYFISHSNVWKPLYDKYETHSFDCAKLLEQNILCVVKQTYICFCYLFFHKSCMIFVNIFNCRELPKCCLKGWKRYIIESVFFFFFCINRNLILQIYQLYQCRPFVHRKVSMHCTKKTNDVTLLVCGMLKFWINY